MTELIPSDSINASNPSVKALISGRLINIHAFVHAEIIRTRVNYGAVASATNICCCYPYESLQKVFRFILDSGKASIIR